MAGEGFCSMEPPILVPTRGYYKHMLIWSATMVLIHEATAVQNNFLFTPLIL